MLEYRDANAPANAVKFRNDIVVAVYFQPLGKINNGLYKFFQVQRNRHIYGDLLNTRREMRINPFLVLCPEIECLVDFSVGFPGLEQPPGG